MPPKTIAQPPTHAWITDELFALLGAKHISQLTAAQQACLECLFTWNTDQHLPLKRLARNHRRLDIGAWVLMYHATPAVHLLTNAYTQLHTHHPELLADPERTTLRHCLTIHSLVTTKQHEQLLAYLAYLPREEQSHTIQAYKHLLINSLTHPNTMSAYLPYLPIEKTVDGYDPASLHLPDLWPYAAAYDDALEQLRTNQWPLLPPRRPIDEIFHDLLLLCNLHAHQLSDEGYQQISAFRAHPAFGLINPTIRQDIIWTGKDQVETPPGNITIADAPSADPYLRHAVDSLSTLYTTIQELIACWAETHEIAYDPTSNYLALLQKIRQHLLHIAQLHHRIDIHYFLRHLPSQSDQNNELISRVFESLDANKNIFEHIKHLHLVCEPFTLLCTSERQYALMSAAILIAHGQHKQITMSAQIYQGLNNYDKTFLQPIQKPTQVIVNEADLIHLLFYLTLVTTTSLHVTHSRVLKRLNTIFSLPETIDLNNGTTLILPFLWWHYHEAGVCTTLEQFLGALEQCRALVHTDAAQRDHTLHNYQKPLSIEGTVAWSITDLCYWIVDYLRHLAAQDKQAYAELYSKIIHVVTWSVRTLELFFMINHQRILWISTDEHTE